MQVGPLVNVHSYNFSNFIISHPAILLEYRLDPSSTTPPPYPIVVSPWQRWKQQVYKVSFVHRLKVVQALQEA